MMMSMNLYDEYTKIILLINQLKDNITVGYKLWCVLCEIVILNK